MNSAKWDRHDKCIRKFQLVGIKVNYTSLITSSNIDEMQLHILECLDSLSVAKESLKEAHQEFPSETANDNIELEKLLTVKYRVFKSAINIILDENSPYKLHRDIIQNFSSDMKLNDNFSWSPFHWAIACGETVTENDVKLIYAANPLALITRHVKGYDECDDFLGHTPNSILLMFKKPSMSLLLCFLTKHPEAFSSDVGGYRSIVVGGYYILDAYQPFRFFPLHLAAQYFESVAALKLIIEFGKKISFKSTSRISGETPLSLLCSRKEFPEFWDMFTCLLEVNSSCEIVENAISCAIKTQGPHTLLLIDKLLKANPGAVNCSFQNLLHEICEHIKGDLCIYKYTYIDMHILRDMHMHI